MNSFFKIRNLFLLMLFVAIVLAVFGLRKYQQAKELAKIEERERNTLRASIITDIDHCPSRSPVPEKFFDQFISFSRGKDIDFVVSLGDNASHRLRNCSETADQDARFIAGRIRGTGKPSHFVLGDHDIASEPASYQEWLKTIGRDSTYYSFDEANVHVVVLDTVLGGEALSPSCEQVKSCSEARERLESLKEMEYAKYEKAYADALKDRKEEKKLQEERYEKELDAIKETRSSGRRDAGRVSQQELDWLGADIEASSKEKVLVFSDHPLFPFTSERKSYDIVNGGQVREILQKSNKQVVCISGEAHLWHEENIEGIQYYIVDEFRNARGSWALFSWDEGGYRLEKITH